MENQRPELIASRSSMVRIGSSMVCLVRDWDASHCRVGHGRGSAALSHGRPGARASAPVGRQDHQKAACILCIKNPINAYKQSAISYVSDSGLTVQLQTPAGPGAQPGRVQGSSCARRWPPAPAWSWLRCQKDTPGYRIGPTFTRLRAAWPQCPRYPSKQMSYP